MAELFLGSCWSLSGRSRDGRRVAVVVRDDRQAVELTREMLLQAGVTAVSARAVRCPTSGALRRSVSAAEFLGVPSAGA